LASTLIMTHGLGLGLEVPWPWPWPRRPMALALNLLASNPSLDADELTLCTSPLHEAHKDVRRSIGQDVRNTFLQEPLLLLLSMESFYQIVME